MAQLTGAADARSGETNELRNIMEGSAFLRPMLSFDESVFRQTFKSMDTNQDHKISRAELVQFAEQANRLAEQDSLKQLLLLCDTGEGDDDTTSADGAITMGELEWAIKNDEEVRHLLRSMPALHPLLAPGSRTTTFKAIDRDGNNKVTLSELMEVSHVARQHADHEFVAKRGGGRPDVVCESFDQMEKVLRTDAAVVQKEQAVEFEKQKTERMSGVRQPKVIVPKRKGVSAKEIKQRARQKDREAKKKYAANLQRVKKQAAMKKYFEASRLSTTGKGSLRAAARAAAMRRSRNAAMRGAIADDSAPSSEEDDDLEDDGLGGTTGSAGAADFDDEGSDSGGGGGGGGNALDDTYDDLDDTMDSMEDTFDRNDGGDDDDDDDDVDDDAYMNGSTEGGDNQDDDGAQEEEEDAAGASLQSKGAALAPIPVRPAPPPGRGGRRPVPPARGRPVRPAPPDGGSRGGGRSLSAGRRFGQKGQVASADMEAGEEEEEEEEEDVSETGSEEEMTEDEDGEFDGAFDEDF